MKTNSDTILEVKDLVKYFPITGGVFNQVVAQVHAVDRLTFSVNRGETLGLVGESGCGKTSVGRTLIRLYEPTGGSIVMDGQDVTHLHGKDLKSYRRKVQMIFQDPYESLNPRHSVKSIVEEPLLIHKVGTRKDRREIVAELLKTVGLNPSYMDRYPHEFSGGQRQRIGIARAVALKPQMLVCDEPVSALDVSIQSQVINLLLELQRDLGLTLVFIAHDLSVVRHVSDRIAVMYLGKIVELTDAQNIYENAKHPYTQALLSSIPVPDPKLRKKKKALEGEVPSPINPPKGCRFNTRCPYAKEICRQEEPKLDPMSGNANHQVACHFTNQF